MKSIDQRLQVASIELAGALLRAWARRDRLAFEAELDRSSLTSSDPRDTGEAERLQMLGAIAARMRASADPFAAGETWESAYVSACSRIWPVPPCRGRLSARAAPSFDRRADLKRLVPSVRNQFASEL